MATDFFKVIVTEPVPYIFTLDGLRVWAEVCEGMDVVRYENKKATRFYLEFEGGPLDSGVLDAWVYDEGVERDAAVLFRKYGRVSGQNVHTIAGEVSGFSSDIIREKENGASIVLALPLDGERNEQKPNMPPL